MMQSAIGQSGTFFIFGIISLLGTVWCYLYLKETSQGLTDKQKKSLYIPDDIKAQLELHSPINPPHPFDK